MSLFAALPRQVSLARQIEGARRELRLRQAVYPRRIADGHMSVEKADEELVVMDAILATLETIAATRDLPNRRTAA